MGLGALAVRSGTGEGARSEGDAGATRRAQESPRSLSLKCGAKGTGAMRCQEKQMAGELLGCVTPKRPHHRLILYHQVR